MVFNKLNLTGNTTNYIQLQKILGFSKSVWQIERLIDLGANLLVWVNVVKPFCLVGGPVSDFVDELPNVNAWGP